MSQTIPILSRTATGVNYRSDHTETKVPVAGVVNYLILHDASNQFHSGHPER